MYVCMYKCTHARVLFGLTLINNNNLYNITEQSELSTQRIYDTFTLDSNDNTMYNLKITFEW